MTLPNSKYIEQQLSEIKNRKDKNAFLESIISNPNATVLHEVNGHRTTLFQGNKGPKTGLFNEAIDYLVRNEIPYGNILLINKYGKVRVITYKDIKSKGYIRKTKGFL